jgi:hypothetical protein
MVSTWVYHIFDIFYFIIFDQNAEISRKSSRILAKLKEMPLDMESFFEQVLLAVIDHFEKFPCLPNAEAGEIVRNLAALYKSAEDMGLPVDLSFKILTNITTLTFHNTPAIRASLKSNGVASCLVFSCLLIPQ